MVHGDLNFHSGARRFTECRGFLRLGLARRRSTEHLCRRTQVSSRNLVSRVRVSDEYSYPCPSCNVRCMASALISVVSGKRSRYIPPMQPELQLLAWFYLTALAVRNDFLHFSWTFERRSAPCVNLPRSPAAEHSKQSSNQTSRRS